METVINLMPANRRKDSSIKEWEIVIEQKSKKDLIKSLGSFA